MHLSVVLLLIAVGALSAAFTSEHLFGLVPCVLCIYQRIPYVIVILFSIASMMVQGTKRACLLALCGLVLLGGSAIALFHVGVEHGVVSLEESCVDQLAEPSSLEELRNHIVGTPAAPCDKPQFVFLGLSMAGWNFFFSFFVGVMTLRLTWRSWRAYRYEQSL